MGNGFGKDKRKNALNYFEKTVLRIRDILVRIRNRWSVTSDKRIRLRILPFSSVTFKMATTMFFCLLVFKGTITSSFTDKKS
jgi:hypothetical protein